MKKQASGYNHKPEQIKKRVQRDKARRLLMAKGKVKKGDGKDVNHKNPIRRGGGNEMANLSVQSPKVNRAWNKKARPRGRSRS
jgi:5-methylcytosine-specific restriction endonuclease McrA